MVHKAFSDMRVSQRLLICAILLLERSNAVVQAYTRTHAECALPKCPPGYGATGTCEGQVQPTCIPCPNGTYSSYFSRRSECRPCSECDLNEEIVLWECDLWFDTVCTKKKTRQHHFISSEESGVRLFRNQHPETDDEYVTELRSTTFMMTTVSLPLEKKTEAVRREQYKDSFNNDDVNSPPQGTEETGYNLFIIIIISLILIIVSATLIVIVVVLRRSKKYDNIGTNRSVEAGDNAIPIIPPCEGKIFTTTKNNTTKPDGMCQNMDSRNPESQTLSGEEYRPHNLESPTDIHCHQSSMHALDIHASPGEFDKSSKITNVNEYITSDTRAPPVSLRKTNYGLDGVFDIVFDGEFDQDGGVLSHEDSDVYVIIPRGAIPVGIIQKVVVRVSLSHSFFRGSLETSHIPMTPVVECLAPGLDRFLKHVTVRLPHHVKMTGSNLKFKLHFSQSLPGNRMTWNSMTHTGQKEANNIVNEVHCTLDGKYVNVHTKHFTTFKCSCGKDVPLNLEAVAFGDHQVFDKQELAVKVYICYRTKDYLERLAVNEGKNQRSEYIPLNARHNAEPYEITCLGDRGAEDPWTSWKLNDHGGAYPAKQVMQLMDIVRHCSDGVSPHRRFVFVPSDDEWKTNFKVLFSVKQPSDEDVNHVPLNMKCGETRIKRITSSSSVGSLSSDLEFKTHEIRKISSKIKTISEMKNLLRILLEDADDLEPTMENIDHDYAPQGADEVKYQLLSLWKSRMGMKASVSDLTNALQECKLNSVAEKLESTV